MNSENAKQAIKSAKEAKDDLETERDKHKYTYWQQFTDYNRVEFKVQKYELYNEHIVDIENAIVEVENEQAEIALTEANIDNQESEITKLNEDCNALVGQSYNKIKEDIGHLKEEYIKDYEKQLKNFKSNNELYNYYNTCYGTLKQTIQTLKSDFGQYQNQTVEVSESGQGLQNDLNSFNKVITHWRLQQDNMYTPPLKQVVYRIDNGISKGLGVLKMMPPDNYSQPMSLKDIKKRFDDNLNKIIKCAIDPNATTVLKKLDDITVLKKSLDGILSQAINQLNENSETEKDLITDKIDNLLKECRAIKLMPTYTVPALEKKQHIRELEILKGDIKNINKLQPSHKTHSEYVVYDDDDNTSYEPHNIANKVVELTSFKKENNLKISASRRTLNNMKKHLQELKQNLNTKVNKLEQVTDSGHQKLPKVLKEKVDAIKKKQKEKEQEKQRQEKQRQLEDPKQKAAQKQEAAAQKQEAGAGEAEAGAGEAEAGAGEAEAGAGAGEAEAGAGEAEAGAGEAEAGAGEAEAGAGEAEAGAGEAEAAEKEAVKAKEKLRKREQEDWWSDQHDMDIEDVDSDMEFPNEESEKEQRQEMLEKQRQEQVDRLYLIFENIVKHSNNLTRFFQSVDITTKEEDLDIIQSALEKINNQPINNQTINNQAINNLQKEKDSLTADLITKITTETQIKKPPKIIDKKTFSEKCQSAIYFIGEVIVLLPIWRLMMKQKKEYQFYQDLRSGGASEDFLKVWKTFKRGGKANHR